MSTFTDLTIAIITYRRPLKLKRCLDSIKNQKYLPKKILIIDSYVRKTNIPESRNIALTKCQTKYLAFVDDDCILDKNWTFFAHQAIVNNSALSFVVGRTYLMNKQNLIAKIQYKTYRDWFKCYHTLDTKNVILNLSSIKKIRFDTAFKIFEDVDFDQQLKSRHLVGIYEPKMILYHPEVSNLFIAVKKNYLRGQYKSKITQKWGNFDNFFPSFFPLSHPIRSILRVSFILGYLKKRPQPITIVNNIDKGANDERLQTFQQFLLIHHLYVTTINSQFEFEKVISSPKYILVYGLPLLKYKILMHFHRPPPIILTLFLRRAIIHRLLTKNHTSLAIIQYPEDMLVASYPNRLYKTLYDSPTIYYRELELANKLPSPVISKLKHLELKVYRNSNYVSFHWYTYFNLAKTYGLTINHPLTLNWSCQPSTNSAHFSPKPKIIHIGKLNSYWVNPTLLTAISRQIDLDIFGYESPDKHIYPNPRHCQEDDNDHY